MGASVDIGQVVVHEALGVLLGGAKVDQVQPSLLRVIKEVAPVGVRLHESPDEELLEGDLQDQPAQVVPVVLGQRAHLVQRDSLHEVSAQHPPAAQGQVDVGNKQAILSSDEIPVPELGLGLVVVVALQGELLLRDFYRVLHVQPIGQQARRSHQPHQVVHVRRDGVRDPRVLNLQADRGAALAQLRLVDLADARGGHRLPLEVLQPVHPAVVQVGGELLLQLRPRHGVRAVPHPFQDLLYLGRDEVLVLDAEHLSDLERGAPHAAQGDRKPLRVAGGEHRAVGLVAIAGSAGPSPPGGLPRRSRREAQS
mmetsp:Transcript_289/g.1085  ORF Transcript_289/g.1085 Transcript_289/m.1085 type:complete len:310 (-) Transcript_289:440-1369(-)